MQSRFLIYGLIDPETLLIRYIGKSSSGLKRPRQHLKEPRSSGPHCKNWVSKLKSKGLSYEITVLEYTNSSELSSQESWWISYGKALQWPLTNILPGEEPNPLDDPGTKDKWRKIMSSPAHRAKMTAIAKLVWQDPELRARHKAAVLRGENSAMNKPGAKEKVGDALRGRPKSDSHIAAIRVSRDSARGKISKTLKSKGEAHASKRPEVKKAIGAASKSRWLDPEFRKRVREAKLKTRERRSKRNAADQ